MNTFRFLLSAAAASAALALSGCASLFTSSTATSVKTALANPNTDAKIVQDAVAPVAAAILANNPSYASEVTAAADGLAALASLNPKGVTQADISAILAKTNLSPADQAKILAGIVLAQGEFLTAIQDLGISLPQLNGTYALFLTAAANGLYIATGHAALPLPTVTVTTTPTPAAATAPALGTAPAPTTVTPPAS
jgi:hypothetical protein